MTTDMKPLAEQLRRWRSRAEEGAGTLPAKGSVGVHPTDWHGVCDGLTEAADALDASAALLREAAEVLGMFGDYTVSSIGMDLDGYVIKLAAGGQQPMFADFDRARALLSRIEAAILSEPSPSNSGDTP